MTLEAIEDGVGLMLSELKKPPEFDAKRNARWVVLFSDWDDVRFQDACLQATRTLTFFPTVGELRKLGEGSLDTRMQDAWEHLREAIQVHGCTASLTASDLGGDECALWCAARMGLDELGNMTEQTRSIKAAEFRRLYALAAEKGYGVTRLPGFFETQNRAAAIDVSGNPALMGRSDPQWHVLPLPELGAGKERTEGGRELFRRIMEDFEE